VPSATIRRLAGNRPDADGLVGLAGDIKRATYDLVQAGTNADRAFVIHGIQAGRTREGRAFTTRETTAMKTIARGVTRRARLTPANRTEWVLGVRGAAMGQGDSEEQDG
jgi:hypothetical protein